MVTVVKDLGKVQWERQNCRWIFQYNSQDLGKAGAQSELKKDFPERRPELRRVKSGQGQLGNRRCET